MTVIGTLTHELGHFLSAKIMGYDARITYQSTYIDIGNKRTSEVQSFYKTLAGPLMTITIGTMAFVLLLKSHNSNNKLLFRQWVLIFLSLFWLRFLANLVFVTIKTIYGPLDYGNGDEFKIAKYLNIPAWHLIVWPAIIAALIVGIIIFKIIPYSQRLTFIIGALFGGSFGYWLWFYFLGPQVMP